MENVVNRIDIQEKTYQLRFKRFEEQFYAQQAMVSELKEELKTE